MYIWLSIIVLLLVIVIILIFNLGNEIIRDNSMLSCNKKVNLYWTGGYDSTFRLLQLIIIENKIVKPYYLNFPTLDGYNIRRKNVKFEIKTMRRIINELRRIGYGDKIRDLQIITDVPLSKEVLDATTILHKQKKIRRAVSQYAHMLQFAIDKNDVFEECAEKNPHSTSYKMLSSILNKNKMLNIDEVIGTPLYAIRNIKFPIIDLTKEDMLKIAKENNFDYILGWTKTCWYPDSKGTPCNKCIMCKDCIIPEKFRSL